MRFAGGVLDEDDFDKHNLFDRASFSLPLPFLSAIPYLGMGSTVGDSAEGVVGR